MKRLSVRQLKIECLPQAEKELTALNIDPFGVRNMAPKMLQRNFLVAGLSSDDAAALKQHFLGIGGDVAYQAATASGIITALLMGSERSFRKLCKDRAVEGGGALSVVARTIAEQLDAHTENQWDIGRCTLDLSGRPLIMGILNVTPDSFSDGGKFFSIERAVERALEMVAEGADIIDIGGESTRPFAPPVPLDEELRRVMPVVEQVAAAVPVPVSIDTYKADVAARTVDAGASIVNDISGLGFDPRMRETVAATGAGVVIMHTRGKPAVMQKDTAYSSLIPEVYAVLEQAVAGAVEAGIALSRIVIDPGIGFGKSREGNLEILRRLPEFQSLGRPLLVGTSRKSFTAAAMGRQLESRLFSTAATVALAVAGGASVLRVHDVAEMRDVADMAREIAAIGS